ncbi:MBL fold metallo-hydrolase [Candidatus Gracilibacteria bacterium]|nr:MBL fold metallo-hydrolase [Candidatus Gracilibacteria bacterium]MCF7819549.1 MBL fold metallo-hydrolase [Candidatus Gracilibacteria bacterium]
MKIQFHGENCFSVQTKDASFLFDPSGSAPSKKYDFATNSGALEENTKKLTDIKKVLSLPGEFEISGILVRGFYSRPENVVYKVTADNVCLVHLGSLESKPSTEFFEKLGENVDIVFVCLSEKFGVKQAKEMIETLDPRMTLIGGDQSFFPKMIESGARMAEEDEITVTQTMVGEEKTDILVLPQK